MRRVISGGTTIAAVTVLVALGSGSARAQATETYVVVLNAGSNSVPAVASQIERTHGGAVGHVYEHALRGFAIRLPEPAVEALRQNPNVAYVEADQPYSVSAQSLPTGIQRVFAQANPNIDIDGSDDERVNVDVAVIDTGIDLDHPDLNIAGSTNCATFFATCGAGGQDGNGHGTHVAGTVGALDNDIGVVGVAPGARLWAVRVLGNNGTGTTSQILAGIDWVAARASTIEVANMSLTGSASQAIDDAANRLADTGVAVAVAAGNNDANAAAYSPARATKILTVSAIADYDGQPGGASVPPSSFCADVDDTSWDASNWGSTIEIAAPGCRILSTYLDGYAWVNGTSMASPHVSGALALLASRGFPRTWAGVSGLYSTLTGAGNFDWTDESGDGVKEPLLDVHDPAVFDPIVVGEPGPPPNAPPAASFTFSCTGLDCSFNGSGSSDSDGSVAAYGWNYGDGTSGSGVTTSKTYAASGTYSVTLTVTDDDGASGSVSQNVSVTAPSSGVSISLSGSSTSQGSRWTAKVTIADASSGSPAAGRVIAGTWSNGATGSSSCTTASNGQCAVSKTGLRKTIASVRFTVDTVDGSSSFGGTRAITVARP
jgi:subtilisin